MIAMLLSAPTAGPNRSFVMDFGAETVEINHN